MKFLIEINCDNAAFTHVTNDESNGEPNPSPEVRSLLLHAIRNLSDDRTEDNPIVLRDTNGHAVGRAYYTEVDQ